MEFIKKYLITLLFLNFFSPINREKTSTIPHIQNAQIMIFEILKFLSTLAYLKRNFFQDKKDLDF